MKSEAFPKLLVGKYIGEGQWELTEPFLYRNPPIEVTVPVGFVSDGASIPKFAYSLIGGPWTGKYAKAAVIHDYLYYVQTMKRWKADKVFYTAMRILGVSRWRSSIMHLSVRAAGWIPWNTRKKKMEVESG